LETPDCGEKQRREGSQAIDLARPDEGSWRDTCISALGVGAASAAGASPLTGLIAGTAVATATTLKNYLTKLHGRHEQKALLAHHLSFEPTTKSH
jgi:hypothetical protein